MRLPAPSRSRRLARLLCGLARARPGRGSGRCLSSPTRPTWSRSRRPCSCPRGPQLACRRVCAGSGRSSRWRAPRGSPARCSGACSSSATRRCRSPGGPTSPTSGSTSWSWPRWSPSSARRCGRSAARRFSTACSLSRRSGLLWWGLVLRDLRLGSDPAALVGLSYPVLDLLLLCTIAATPLVSARRGTLAGWLVAAAVAVGGIADGVYAQLVLDDRYSSGRLVDLGWQLEACLICLAAVAAAFGIGRGPAWAQRRSPLRIRTAASMSVALIVILIVLVFESARATSRRRRRWASCSSSPRCCSSGAGCS